MRVVNLDWYGVYIPPNIYDEAEVVFSFLKYFDWDNSYAWLTRTSDSDTEYAFFDGASAETEATLNGYTSNDPEVPTTTTLSTYIGANSADMNRWIGQIPDGVYDGNFILNGNANPSFISSGTINVVNSEICTTFNGSNESLFVTNPNWGRFTNGTIDIAGSISIDINFNSLTTCRIVNKRNNSFKEWDVNYNNSVNQLSFVIFSGGAATPQVNENISWTPSTNTWYNIVVTYDGNGSGGQKIYIDGVLQATTTTETGTYVKMNQTTAPIVLAKIGDASSNYFNGSIKQFAFWQKELSQGEIDTL